MAEQASLSGLTPDQAKEFHEQWKITYTTFAGLAAVAHLLVLAWKPWF
ncbi:MAG: light-harvesting protein [Chromatiaceae bacterium]|nr:MAG: light-harvesting protein [Chromatiaceae bacterium]